MKGNYYYLFLFLKTILFHFIYCIYTWRENLTLIYLFLHFFSLISHHLTYFFFGETKILVGLVVLPNYFGPRMACWGAEYEVSAGGEEENCFLVLHHEVHACVGVVFVLVFLRTFFFLFFFCLPRYGVLLGGRGRMWRGVLGWSTFGCRWCWCWCLCLCLCLCMRVLVLDGVGIDFTCNYNIIFGLDCFASFLVSLIVCVYAYGVMFRFGVVECSCI